MTVGDFGRAKDISSKIRAGELSACDVVTAHIHRIAEVNPKINAIVAETTDVALSEAKRIDQEVAGGGTVGPLAGVPFTIKVNVDQERCATTNGLVLQKNLIAEVDSPLVSNIRKAGGIIVGRTNTPAFSLRWFTNNNLHGETLNPRNSKLTPGGSSGGAAAAVAAGLCVIGHGTDIAGSIRYPAYACGVHGLRPSHGRIPARNATAADRMIGAQLMAVSGPIARSISDLKLAFHAMAAPDIQDPWHVDVPFAGRAYEKRAALTLTPDGMTVDPRVQDALRRAALILEAAGWQVDEIDGPPVRRAAEINATLWMAETEQGAVDMIAREEEPDSQFVFAAMRRLAGPISLEAVLSALQGRTALIREWEQFLQTYPLVISPISGELPFTRQRDVRSETDFEQVYEAQLTQRGLPVLGLPALAVATGTEGDSPLGVQLISARFREDILFDAGAIIEAASPPVEIAKP